MKVRNALGLALALSVGLSLCVLLALGARCDDDRARVDSPPRVPLHHAFEELSDEEIRVGLRLLQDAPGSFAERWRMLDDAKRSLQVAYFILHDDAFGLAFLGRLHERAEEGVTVRLLVDARGSKPLVSAFGGRALLEALAASGDVEVRVYNPPLQSLGDGLKELQPLLPAARSHLKMIVRDGEEGLVGGRNIAADYFTIPNELPAVAYDVDVTVRSEQAAIELVHAFATDFEAPFNKRIQGRLLQRPYPRHEELSLYARAMDLWLKGALGPLSEMVALPLESRAVELERRAVASLPVPPSFASLVAARPMFEELVRYESVYAALDDDGDTTKRRPFRNVRARVLYDDSRAADADRAVWRGMLAVLRAAEKEVHIESPYLVLTEDGLRVLEELSRRGVVVHLYTNGPRSSDNALSQALFIEAWPEILARAPTLRLYVSDGEQLMHAKRMVVDDKLTLVGTYNLDLLSALVNSELMLAIWDEGFAKDSVVLMKERRARPHVRRYRIARDDEGAALRHPRGHPQAGEVVVLYGPADHTPPEQLDDLLFLRELVTTFDHFAELEPAVW